MSGVKYKFGVDRYVAISHAIKQVLVNDGIPADRIEVVHSGIDLGRFENADTEEVLRELLAPFGYALIWDVVDGPLGPLPKLAEIQIFRPGEKKRIEPLFDKNANLQVTTGPEVGGPLFVEDEILLAVTPKMRVDEFRLMLAQIGGTVIDSVPGLGIYRVRLLPGINVPALVQQLEGADAASLRTFVDTGKVRLKSGVVVAGTEADDRALLAVGVTTDLTDRLHAGRIVGEIASLVDGGGGGRADLAQAGGKNPARLSDALDSASSIIERML